MLRVMWSNLLGYRHQFVVMTHAFQSEWIITDNNDAPWEYPLTTGSEMPGLVAKVVFLLYF